MVDRRSVNCPRGRGPRRPVNRLCLGPRDGDAALARLDVRSSSGCSRAAIVQMRDLVDRPHRDTPKRPRPCLRPRPARRCDGRVSGRKTSSSSRQGSVLVAGRQDGQSNYPGLHRRKPFDVAPGVDLRAGRDIAVGTGQGLKVVEAHGRSGPAPRRPSRPRRRRHPDRATRWARARRG